MLEVGTFVLFNILGFGLMGYGTQAQLPLAKPLALFAMLAFLIMAFWMLQPEDIGMINITNSTITDGVTTWTEDKAQEQIIISDEFTNFLQWVYFGLAMLAFLVFALKVIF